MANFVFEYPQGRYRKDKYKDEPWYGKYVCRVFYEPSAIENRGAGRGYLIINTEKLRGKNYSVMFFEKMPHLGDIIYVDGQRRKALFHDRIPYIMKKGAIDVYNLIVGPESFSVAESPVFRRIIGL